MNVKLLVLLLGAGVLSACAAAHTSTPQSYVAAQTAVSNAEKMPVSTYGNQELTVARQRLEASRIAAESGQTDLAEMLAVESIVSVDLAVAKTTLGKTAATNREMKVQSEAMRQEMLRNKKVSP